MTYRFFQSQSDQNNEDSLHTPKTTQVQGEDENLPPPPEYDEEEISPDNRIDIPTIVYRSSWGASAPRGRMEELKLPVSEVLVTFTGTEECLTNHECLDLVENLQRRDIYGKCLPDIQYNFLVGGDGVIYEGRGLQYHADKDPEHMDLKGTSLDIAYIGNFKDSVPLKSVIRSCAGLLQTLVENGYVSSEFNLTPLAKSQSVYDKGDGGKGEESVMENHEDVQWNTYPGFKNLDEILEKSLF